MKIDQSENLIRKYLLGEMAEADQTAFEHELLIDRDKFNRVWAVEDDLVDSYARGEMSRADRKRFEAHYLASALHRERVAIAEAFLADIDRGTGETGEVTAQYGERERPGSWSLGLLIGAWVAHAPRTVRPVFGMALVMVLLLAFSLVWSYIERIRLTGQIANVQKEARTEREFLNQRERELASRNQELEKEIADVSRRNGQLKAEIEELRLRRQDAAPAFLSFLLAPAPVRGEKAMPQTTIPLLTEKARLLMDLGGDDYASYQAVLQTVEGREILRRRAGKVRLRKDRAFAALTIKAGELSRGDYILILFSQTSDSNSEEIDRYFFRVP